MNESMEILYGILFAVIKWKQIGFPHDPLTMHEFIFFRFVDEKFSFHIFFSFWWKLQSLFLIKSFLMRNHLSTYTISQLGFVSAKFMRRLLKWNALDCVTSGYEF